jgi:hypothetical protein
MKINYHEKDDILHIEFSDAPIVREVSKGWNVNLAFSEVGLVEITILDAKAKGYWPIENVKDLISVAA